MAGIMLVDNKSQKPIIEHPSKQIVICALFTRISKNRSHKETIYNSIFCLNFKRD